MDTARTQELVKERIGRSRNLLDEMRTFGAIRFAIDALPKIPFWLVEFE